MGQFPYVLGVHIVGIHITTQNFESFIIFVFYSQRLIMVSTTVHIFIMIHTVITKPAINDVDTN